MSGSVCVQGRDTEAFSFDLKDGPWSKYTSSIDPASGKPWSDSYELFPFANGATPLTEADTMVSAPTA